MPQAIEPRTYTIHGDPVPLARPRFSYISAHIYDSQICLKRAAMHALLKQNEPRYLYVGPCSVEVTFYLKLPKSMSPKKMKMREESYHVYRPDLDNLCKFLCDVIQMKDDDEKPLLLNDDSIICVMNARKLYSAQPRTIFTITELK